jgi:carbamoylphosphate synthase large subunit
VCRIRFQGLFALLETAPLAQPFKPRLLLVAATTGYQTRSFAEAARRQGIEVVLATDRCHILEDPWLDNATPVRFEEPRAIENINVDGIIAVADRPTLVAALTAASLELPWHSPASVTICRDKHRMRELFDATGLLVPRHFAVPADSEAGEAASRATFPCVLKPLGLSASRGVIRANDTEEFIAAFHRIRRILQQPEIRHLHEEWNEAIQIEDFIEGREFALEGVLTNGDLQVLAIFDKPDPLDGPFFEETIYVTPSRESAEVQRAIVEATRGAIAAIGLSHGPVHAEMRVNSRGVYMLEVAARPIGGLCAKALRFEGDLTLEDLLVLHAVGTPRPKPVLASPATGVMMIPIPRAGIYQSVDHTFDADVDEIVITAIPGQKLIPLPEGASYLGFIFASGRDPAAVEASLRRAHARLEFEILTALDIVFN